MNSDIQDYLFDLQGYLLLENAVDPKHIADLNEALDRFPALAGGQWHGNVQRHDNVHAWDIDQNCGIELQNIVEGGEPFERLIDHPSWIELLRHYCGEEASYVPGLYIDECFASIRRSGGFFPIHSGGWQGAIRGQYRYVNNLFRCAQVNILLALTDIGPGDGGTMIVPGSHKSNFPHPQAGYQGRMDELIGVVELNMKAGDALLFVDALSHGASSRTNPGERRVCIYRYGVSWGATRYGYRYSDALLDRLTPERRAILQPIPALSP